MTRFRTGVLALAAAALLTLAAPATPASGPQWRAIPLAYRPGADFRVLGYASGRVWIETGGSGFTVLSATVSGGKLGGFVTTKIAGWNPWAFGNELVYQPGTFGNNPSVIAPLLANGHVGPAGPLPGDPETAARKVIDPTGSAGGSAGARAAAAITANGRTIWALEGGSTKSVNGGLASLVLCCTDAGDAVDLTLLLTSRQQGIFPSSLALGLDTKGRLWLAWTDSRHNVSTDPNLTGHLVQLEPSTLNGVTANTTTPVFAPSYLACAELCRLVFANRLGTTVWRGVGTPATVLAGHPYVLGADVRAGRLELVNQDKQQLVLRRGSPTGTGLKISSSITVPKGIGSPNDLYGAVSLAAVAGTPHGVVAIQPYVDFRDRTRVYAAVLP